MLCAKSIVLLKTNLWGSPLEDESDREVEEHVGERSDPADPKKLPNNQSINQLEFMRTLHDIGLGEGRKKT